MWSDRLRRLRDAALVAGEDSANAVVGLLDRRLRTSRGSGLRAAA